MLVLVGLGLWDEKDITLRGLEEARSSDIVFIESYTSNSFGASKKEFEKLIGKPITLAGRELVENGKMLADAKQKKVCLLVTGDPLVATTHADLLLRCKQQGIETKVVHNASIYNALADTGLQFYKFGRATTVTFWTDKFRPTSFYDVIAENKKRGLHTLVFLDLRADENKYMTANEAIELLSQVERQKRKRIFLPNTSIIVCCRMGSPQQRVHYGTLKELKGKDFGKPFHTIIVPGKLHEVEEQFLEKVNED